MFLSGRSICDWNNGTPLGVDGDEGIYCDGQGKVVEIELGKDLNLICALILLDMQKNIVS